MKYRVVISTKEYHEFRVDATDEDEALDIAEEMARREFFPMDFDVEDVEEE